MERYSGTFWAIFAGVVIAIAAIVWFASPRTMGPNTASNEPALTTPATPPAVKPQSAPTTPTTP